jgi:hypothetical protein
MPEKTTNSLEQTRKYAEGSGTKYHQEHSSQVPDYVPNETQTISNSIDTSKQE